MESVMNFLAEYYVWFFVAAGVLCFALLGFILDSKKKQKGDFKGESINAGFDQNPNVNTQMSMPTENVNAPSAPVEPVAPVSPSTPVTPEIPVSPAAPVSPVMPTDSTANPEILGQTVSIGGEATLGNPNSEELFEINDIPILEEATPTNSTEPLFFSGPIEMPSVEEQSFPSAPQAETQSMVGEPVVFESVQPVINEPVVNSAPTMEINNNVVGNNAAVNPVIEPINNVVYQDIAPIQNEIPAVGQEPTETLDIFEEIK